MRHTKNILFLAIFCILACQNNVHAQEYLVGLGKADITGPVADIQLMGYANPSQIGTGLHTRLFARTVIVADASNPRHRFAFVNLDACMAAQAVTFTVIQRLKDRFGPDLYTEQNVIVSGTHTHSGPAGYLQYVVYDITGLGFVPQSFEALVNGIVNSISRAHADLHPGRLSLAVGELLDANINRSPTAYMQNPEEERNQYEYDVDKEMTVLIAEDTDGAPCGAFSWFPVHGTSMNNTNTLVNGDNKGAAAQFMEKWASQQPFEERNSKDREFVAAFCQANVGDTSPNTLGPLCMDTGEPCDAVHSTCGGRVEQCIGRGPGWPNHFESTRIIAQKQAEKAQNLVMKRITSLKDKRMRVSGPIEFRHMFVDMRKIQIAASNFTRSGHTCLPAMGFAFAAGTTDGPGAFDFKQSDTNGTIFWRIVRDFIHMPSTAQTACHAPKPILLDVGEMHFPYEWVPYIVEIQIVRVGQLVILAVPGEFTTMAGRRLKAAVDDILRPIWGGSSAENESMELHYVIAGLSNTYSSYITTFEEYQVQRYEGGFTLFGPHTLDAYIQEFRKLAQAMVDDQPTESGPDPPNLLSQQWSLVPGVVADGVPSGVSFGDVVAGKDVSSKNGLSGNNNNALKDQLESSFGPGDAIEVQFHSACPRNDLRSDDTYLTVERLVQDSGKDRGCESLWESFKHWLFGESGDETVTSASDGAWEVVHTDNDWETKFYWNRHEHFSTYSFATVVWNVPNDVMPGLYRIRHFGNYKHFLGEIHPFEGSSSVFRVENKGQRAVESVNNAGLWEMLLIRLGRRAGGIFSTRF